MLPAIPSAYSAERYSQTGSTREQTVVLLLAAGRQLLGQVFVIGNERWVYDRLHTLHNLVLPTGALRFGIAWSNHLAVFARRFPVS